MTTPTRRSPKPAPSTTARATWPAAIAAAGLLLVTTAPGAPSAPRATSTPAAAPRAAAGPSITHPVPSITVEPLGGSRNKVTFTYQAPAVNRCFLVGEFNKWNTGSDEMKKTGDMFSKALDLEDGIYEYKFLCDNNDWRPDPLNRERVDDHNGGKNTVVRVGRAFTVVAAMTAPSATPTPAPAPGGLVPLPGVQAAAPAPTAQVQWLDDPLKASSQAQATGKRVLLYFSNPGARVSQFVEASLFTDPAVSNYIASQMIPAKIDISKQPDIARSLQVFRGGTVVIYRPDGSFEKKVEQFTTPDQLLKDLQP